jgi:hypothetical protein
MDKPGNSVIHKKRGRPRASWRANLLSFRVDYDLEWELENWAVVAPQTSKPLAIDSHIAQKRTGGSREGA